MNTSPQMDPIPNWSNIADILKLLFLQPTNQRNGPIEHGVLEKINPRLARKFHAFYGNRCSKHLASCRIPIQMNPFRASALCFFKVHLMFFVQLALPSAPFLSDFPQSFVFISLLPLLYHVTRLSHSPCVYCPHNS